MDGDRWIEVAPSQFDHERQGLELVKALLPDAPPFRAWSNFEFRDNRGRWHEVDLLVLARDTMYLIELKYYSGLIRGNDHVWTRHGHRSEDSPLLLARRKAQYFSSLLKDRLREKTGADPRGVVPYVQELVFLHHHNFRVELPASSTINLYGPDGATTHTNLPGLSERLLAPSRHAAVSEEKSLLIRDLMSAIGLAPRRQREVGSWIIDDQPIADGEGWQDWPAFHRVDTEKHARIRFYLPKPGATQAENYARARAVEHEYRLLTRLKHDGLQVPEDIVKLPELGVGLVFPQSKDDEPLDLWLADHGATLAFDAQIELISQIAEVVFYAHRNRVVHRTLNPRAITVRLRSGRVVPTVVDWDCAGVLPANAETGVSHLSAGPMSVMAASPPELAFLFAAPEGPKSAQIAQLDVFGLGALAFFILTGGALPAIDRGELIDRLRRDRGFDLSAERPQIPTLLRQLVLSATRPSPAERTESVMAFVEDLATARQALQIAVDDADPLAAGPGALLADGRFEYKRMLGAGSTAVGILVVDHSAVDAERVLKVAKNDEAAGRLRAEAQALQPLDDPRIATLHSLETIGNRVALVLQFAGASTLAEELDRHGRRLSLDVLERWGSDLLAAVVTLEREGVSHRDIKPANLGVWQPKKNADARLVMFDFSMAGVDARNIDAGSPPYLDPFLGIGERKRYDSAAERYSAAVVLFEMATATIPQYGPDSDVNPATVDDEVTLVPDLFDPTTAVPMMEFFASALSRGATRRPDTAEDMLRAWRRIFAVVDAPAAEPVDRDALAAAATVSTPLAQSGLSARAVSALDAAGLTTVGELLAVDPARRNRLGTKERRGTSGEIKNRVAEWSARLGTQRPPATSDALIGLDDAVTLLHEALGGGRTFTRRTAADLLLGVTPGLDAFATGAELAAALGKSVQRSYQLQQEMQADWSDSSAARQLLDGIIELVRQVLQDFGGVVNLATLIAEIRARMPHAAAEPSDVVAQAWAERAAAGLLRAALDRHAEIEQATGVKELVRRRHGGRLTLLATDERLLAAAEAAAKRADELVVPDREAVLPASTAVRELQDAFARGYGSLSDGDERPAVPADARLVRLAAVTSNNAAVSGRGELHSRELSPSEAVRRALSGVGHNEALPPGEVIARVAARFPEIDRLPLRPHLDGFVERSGIGLEWTQDGYRFPASSAPGGTNLHTRPASVTADAAEAFAVSERSGYAAALMQSVAECGFMAIGVPVPAGRPGEHGRVAQLLANEFGGQIIDVTGLLMDAMRERATAQGVPWDLVRSADAAAPGTRDAQGLAALMDRVMPAVTDQLRRSAFEGESSSSPLILTELSPLARYGHLGVMAELSDLTAPRRRPVWLVLPQIRGARRALVDRTPLQLGSPGGQFVVWEPVASSERLLS